MIAAPPSTTHAIEFRRTFDTPRERVYRAWTEAETLARWFAPSSAYTVVVHAFEPRVGGEYRIEMRHSSGKAHVVVGTYREVDPPSRLAFTWRWEEDAEASETLVTLELAARDGATELLLRHELFIDETTAQKHNEGWTGCLDRMSSILESPPQDTAQ